VKRDTTGTTERENDSETERTIDALIGRGKLNAARDRLDRAAIAISEVLDAGERDPRWPESQELENAAIAYGQALREQAMREAEIDARNRAAFEAESALVEQCIAALAEHAHEIAAVTRSGHCDPHPNALVEATVRALVPGDSVENVYWRVVERMCPSLGVPF
jgi:hypothetical protein